MSDLKYVGIIRGTKEKVEFKIHTIFRKDWYCPRCGTKNSIIDEKVLHCHMCDSIIQGNYK